MAQRILPHAALLGALVAACDLVTGLDGFEVAVPGPAPTCTVAAECPGQDDECRHRTCESGVCGTEDVEKGVACGESGWTCDGAGRCVAPDGEGCADAGQCASGHCAQDVCCASACEGACGRCDMPGTEGTCTPLGAGELAPGCEPGRCDGSGNCATGAHVWTRTFGDIDDQQAVTVAVDGAGGVVATGLLAGSVLVAGEQLAAFAPVDQFVVALSPAGDGVWGTLLHGPEDDLFATLVVPDLAGDLLVGGSFVSELSIDGRLRHVEALGSNPSVWAGKLSGDAGVAAWTIAPQKIDDFPQRLSSIAATADGGLIAVGWYAGTINFGPPVGVLQAQDVFDAFVVKLDGGGAPVWGRTYGRSGSQTGFYDVGLDAAGNVYLLGFLYGTVDFGGGDLDVPCCREGIVLVSLAPDGGFRSAVAFGDGAAHDIGGEIAVGPAGDLAIAGYTYESVDFGGGAIGAGVTDVSADAFIAFFDASGGHVWSQAYGDGGDQHVYDLARDGAGNVVAVGSFDGEMMFEQPLVNPDAVGYHDAFVVKLSAAGLPLWSKSAGAAGVDDDGWAVAVGPDDEVVLAGEVRDTIDWGGDPHTTAGGSDAFVTKLEP
jgi:hypothetical protein